MGVFVTCTPSGGVKAACKADRWWGVARKYSQVII